MKVQREVPRKETEEEDEGEGEERKRTGSHPIYISSNVEGLGNCPSLWIALRLCDEKGARRGCVRNVLKRP